MRSLSETEPAKTLLRRARAELPLDFPADVPTRVSVAPGRLDVMGGIAEEMGSATIGTSVQTAAAVIMQRRTDGNLQLFSFNLYDTHQPFTFRIPLQSLAKFSAGALRQEFAAPGRQWAAPLAGCLAALHEAKFIDLLDRANPKCAGFSMAVLNDVPAQVGLGSTAAVVVAAMVGYVAHFELQQQLDSVRIAQMCQRVLDGFAGRSSGVGAILGSLSRSDGASLHCVVSQPVIEFSETPLPHGVHVVGIDSGVKRNHADAYQKMRVAAQMSYHLILKKMAAVGLAAGRRLVGDPMAGFLTNLDPDAYKTLFRPGLPEFLSGEEFLTEAGPIDSVFNLTREERYPVRHAADHHVLEARRVRRFTEFLTEAGKLDEIRRLKFLNMAGHLMYASHLSYTNDAMLGTESCDLLVQLLRDREGDGIYGARITGSGGGGVIAVLLNANLSANQAVVQALEAFAANTGLAAKVFSAGVSVGASSEIV